MNGKKVILCIDDDKDLLDSLRLIFEANGFAVEQAESAEEGIVKFKETNPDLVIVDLMMEEVDAGVNFVKEIKAAGSKTPVYMLSSVGNNLNMNTNYAELGLTGVLQKPIDPDMLVKTVKAKTGQ